MQEILPHRFGSDINQGIADLWARPCQRPLPQFPPVRIKNTNHPYECRQMIPGSCCSSVCVAKWTLYVESRSRGKKNEQAPLFWLFRVLNKLQCTVNLPEENLAPSTSQSSVTMNPHVSVYSLNSPETNILWT